MFRSLSQRTVCLTLAAVSACMPAAGDRVPVRGKIQFQGRPLSGGMIAFAADPQHGTLNEMAVGHIQPDGSYRLQKDDGTMLAVGWYRVTVVAKRGSWVQLPAKYRDPASSGLRCRIAPGHENIVDFSLKE